MASLRDSVKDYQEELRDGIAWVAFWKQGRSWNAELFHLEVDGTLEPFDRSRLEEIKAADPAAVILNGYYCGHLGEDKRVLHNEACNAHDEIRRRRIKEVSFSDLSLHEERQLYTFDKYFQDEETEPGYQQAGKKITPKLLLEAIRTLPEEKRKAIMLYYFDGLTDVEIGKLFNTSRSTIQYRRTSSFEHLRKYLEEHADEWDEW